MSTQTKSILIGAVCGAGLGALGGYLFAREREEYDEYRETQALSLQSVRPGDVVKLLIAIMGVLRGVAELGERT